MCSCSAPTHLASIVPWLPLLALLASASALRSALERSCECESCSQRSAFAPWWTPHSRGEYNFTQMELVATNQY